MGFGSYDESEQENRNFDTDLEDESGVATSEADHKGEVEFDFGDTTSDELLDKFKEINGE